MALNNRYTAAAFCDEEDSVMATPMHTDGAVVQLKFCIIPQRCRITNKWLWLTTAYRIREEYYSTNMGMSYPEHRVTYTKWVSKHEYLKWVLTQ